MKTRNTILIGIATVVLIVVVAGIYLWSSLDKLVEAAIEKHGSQVTQTKVAVDGVKLALTSGKGSISGISIGNPAGFSRKNIFTLDNISVALDTSTVTKDVVVIDEILVHAPQVFYEINDKGTANVNVLKQNLGKATGGTKAAGSDGGKEVKLIIRKLVIEQGEIDARIAALGDKDLSANLPRIVMTDIGKKSGGATASEVAEQVTSTLIAKVGPAVANLGVSKYLGKTAEEAKAQLEGKVQESIKEKTKGLGLDKLLGK